MQQIHHKKNEKQEVEFFKDKECTEAFDFTGTKDLYIELKDGDITPFISKINPYVVSDQTIYIPYINNNLRRILNELNTVIDFCILKTLDDITPNLSKYIPEDNAVLFLNEEDYKRHKDCFIEKYVDNFLKKLGFLIEGRYDTIYSTRPFVYDKDLDFGLTEPYPKTRNVCWGVTQTKNITLFLPHGTQSEIQKANELEKELKAKYGVKKVNLFVLHCFVEKKHLIKAVRPSKIDRMYKYEIYGYAMQKLCKNINKIITTNSTGILKSEESNERLQVIDSKEIFEEYLKESN